MWVETGVLWGNPHHHMENMQIHTDNTRGQNWTWVSGAARQQFHWLRHWTFRCWQLSMMAFPVTLSSWSHKVSNAKILSLISNHCLPIPLLSSQPPPVSLQIFKFLLPRQILSFHFSQSYTLEVPPFTSPLLFSLLLHKTYHINLF